jgi:hypothetical protein
MTRTTRVVLPALCLCWAACALTACVKPEEGAHDVPPLVTYRTQAESLQALLATSDVSNPRLEVAARGLVRAALPVLHDFAQAHPDCSDGLGLVVDAVELLDALSAAELERVWYHDGSMPPPPARCQHAQDLLIRPARLVVRLRKHETAREALQALIAPLQEDIRVLETVF